MASTPSRIGANTAANLAGSLAASAINLAIVPTYIRLLGMESLGLIGLNASITLIIGLADFGLAPTLAREMARSWRDEADIVQGRTMLQTLHRMYVPLAVLLGLIVVITAPVINARWLNASGLGSDTVTATIRLIGIGASCQLLGSFYGSGLNGLQRQVVGNVIATIASLVQAAGAYVLIRYLHHGIVGFFVWQVCVLACAGAATALVLFGSVPGRGKGLGFQPDHLRRVGGYALGMTGISLVSIVLTQTDKVVLSKVLSLESFGYYSLAAMIAMSMRKLFGPLFAASFPRFTELVRSGAEQELARTYRVVAQAMTIVVIPSSLIVLLHAHEVVFAWTGSHAVASNVQPVVVVLVAGVALTGITQTPYALQLAHGWTKLAFLLNLVASAVFVPAVIVTADRFGALGVAYVLLGLNCMFVFVQTPLMHRRLLVGGYFTWLVRDCLLPSAAAAIPAVAALPLISRLDHRLTVAVALAVTILLSTACAVVAADQVRDRVLERLRRR